MIGPMPIQTRSLKNDFCVRLNPYLGHNSKGFSHHHVGQNLKRLEQSASRGGRGFSGVHRLRTLKMPLDMIPLLAHVW